MLLAFDIGNTKTNYGVFDEDVIVARGSFATDANVSLVRAKALLEAILSDVQLSASEITQVAYACVVPALTQIWEQAWANVFKVKPLACNAQTAQGLFETTYPNPSEIGADRIADAIALRSLYAKTGAASAVVDFGTATNIEILDAQGCFIGGIIAPGAETSMDALFSHAAKLPRLSVEEPGHVIGTCTNEAIMSGIVHGEAARADGLLSRVLEELGQPNFAAVVATGGLANLVAKYSSMITAVDKDLTLKGLHLLASFRCPK